MNGPDTLSHFKDAVRGMPAVVFIAWRGSQPVTGCDALQSAQTAQDAIDAVLLGTKPKTTVFVLEDDMRASLRTLRIYQTKKSTKKGHWRASTNGGRKVFEGATVADLLIALPVLEFEPKPPFDAFVDDAVGHDFTLIEGKVL